MTARLSLSIRVHLWFIPAIFLAGCDAFEAKQPPRNFNELIPRLMGAVNNRTPEDAAINLFNVTSPDERRDAIAYLQTKPYGHQPPYMKAYQILTTDPHPMVRAQAIRALGTSRSPAIVPYLIDGNGRNTGLVDPDLQVRRDAATSLTITFNDSATEATARALKEDADEQVRINCARALRGSSKPEAIRALIASLEDNDAAVCSYSLESLVAITHQAFAYDAKAWLTWYEQTYVASPATATRPRHP